MFGVTVIGKSVCVQFEFNWELVCVEFELGWDSGFRRVRGWFRV